MGLLDFFKSFGKTEAASAKVTTKVNARASMPTIKPDKEIFKCYDEVFRVMIADISGISTNDANAIHSIIKKCDGGFLNMACYHAIIWEEYFKTKDWHWNEYEEWNKIYTKLGKYPSRFPMKNNFIPASIGQQLSRLTVNELKKIGAENEIVFPPKAKKNDLVEGLKSVPNISSSPIVSAMLAKLNKNSSYGLYSLFMRTMNFRGKCLYDTRRAAQLGIRNFKILHVFEEDKDFVEMALKMNPNALHPVFPSDMSTKQAVIDF